MRPRHPLTVISLALPLAGCAGTPLGYLDAVAPASAPIARLGWGLTLISVVACVVTAALLAVAMAKRRPDDAGAITPVNDRKPIGWIVFGVAVSTVFLVAAAIWTLVTVGAIGMPARTGLTVEITGQQWWWAVRYRSPEPGRIFTTANQLVIPVGVPVKVLLKSKDVIHSFWVPKLGGKIDMLPERTNVTWLQADRPGTYRGQCTEFCGLQHANMAFDVLAVRKADFKAWWDRQLTPAKEPPEAFMSHCAACHAVRGTAAGGILGPDLTDFKDRRTIAAGTLPNTRENLERWLENAQAIKPGSKMPTLDMTGSEVRAISGYLEGVAP